MAVRRLPAIAALLVLAACGSSKTAPTSTALAGSMNVFSAKGDDFSYFFDITLNASGIGALVTSANVTITNSSSSFSAPLGLASLQLPGSSVVSLPRVVIPNKTGQAYATTMTVKVTYVDDFGRSGELELTSAAPSCQSFVFTARCDKTSLQVGETSACSGFVQFVCQPNFLPLTANQIDWTSTAPQIAALNSGFRLAGLANGTATVSGSYSGVSSSFPVCVGPSCAAGAR